MAKYPIGIQDFPRIINEKFLYIDKTQLLYPYIQEGRSYFLARPRRFGKSLLVSTLESLFEGKRELFSGLWIDSSDYDWQKYPVIRLDFSELVSSSDEHLIETLNHLLDQVSEKYAIDMIESQLPSKRFSHLINSLAKIHPVVILIDEYDRPIINHLNDPERMRRNKEIMRDFLVIVKSTVKHQRFVLVTGVSQFSQVSLFSDLNSLDNHSFDQHASTLLGWTEEEIRTFLYDEIRHIAEQREESIETTIETMRHWYNGYRFAKPFEAPTVYNPLSVMQFLNKRELDNYWFSTATPKFAIDLIKQNNYPVMQLEEGVLAGDEIKQSYQVEDIDLPTLLFQTGYLTIADYDKKMRLYELRFPNEEVHRSFLQHLLTAFSEARPSDINRSFLNIANHLKAKDLDQFFSAFNTLLASIPHHIHIDKEAYYHSLLYLLIKSLGFKVDAEVTTSRGRIDMLIKTKKSIFVFEFKMNESSEQALNQIQTKDYHKQFLMDERELVLVGANFDFSTKSLNDWCHKVVKKT